jgi:hypothetical protein
MTIKRVTRIDEEFAAHANIKQQQRAITATLEKLAKTVGNYHTKAKHDPAKSAELASHLSKVDQLLGEIHSVLED